MVSSNLEVSGFKPRKKRGVTPRADKGKKAKLSSRTSSALHLLQTPKIQGFKKTVTVNSFGN